MPTHATEPSAKLCCFQIGTRAFTSSINSLPAAKASPRCPAATATTTARSPMASKPVRWTAATAIASCFCRNLVGDLLQHDDRVGMRLVAQRVTSRPPSEDRTVPMNTVVPPAAGSATAASTSSTDNGRSRIPTSRTTAAGVCTERGRPRRVQPCRRRLARRTSAAVPTKATVAPTAAPAAASRRPSR